VKKKMPNWREVPRAELETIASATTNAAAFVDQKDLGEARAELVRRDREYAEAQEQSRRKYEDERAATRREFEEQLMRRQMEHASNLAEEQLNTARSAARAARWSAVAATIAAAGVIGQIIIAIVNLAQ
jgi:hypothetical protein